MQVKHQAHYTKTYLSFAETIILAIKNITSKTNTANNEICRTQNAINKKGDSRNYESHLLLSFYNSESNIVNIYSMRCQSQLFIC